ncbi:Nucleoside diphosphate kinase [uncultured archaeon]|nr:Nucleoside diphosphate kinase [uncultured archaeon]
MLEGENVVAEVRKITGYTDPAKAEKGTVRGDLGRDSIVQANLEGRPVHNLVHASGTVDEANLEIALWFKPKEVWGADRN